MLKFKVSAKMDARVQRRPPPARQKRPLKPNSWRILVALTLHMLLRVASPEERSILHGATNESNDLHSDLTMTDNALTDGCFKSIYHSKYQSSSIPVKEHAIVLSEPQSLVTVHVTGLPWTDNRIATSAIYVGDAAVFLSAANSKCSADFFEGGFHEVKCKGSRVSLRRENGQYGYIFNQVRVYQTPNLLKELAGSVTVSAPSPISPEYSADNLISNLEARSSGNNQKPFESLTQQASYESCYKTSQAQFTGTFVLGFNLGKPVFQHCVLVVQDLYDGHLPSHHTNANNEFFQNYEVYIGNDPDYTKNTRCPGGPFMKTDDTTNYTPVQWRGSSAGNMWNYGKEIWCNLEGQYTHIVADYSSLSTFEISICSVGIMGTEYDRATPMPSEIEILLGQTHTLSVEAITSTMEIGNTLDIELRLQTALSWVSIVSQNPAVVEFTPTSADATTGVHEIVFESTDKNSNAVGAPAVLKTDKIAVKIYEYKRATPVQSEIQLTYGTQNVLKIPYVLAEPPIQTTNDIRMRQKASSELAWVAITHMATVSVVTMDARTVPGGSYTLVLESFDDLIAGKPAVETIEITLIQECKVLNWLFEQKSTSATYKIGSGALTKSLPNIIEDPRCSEGSSGINGGQGVDLQIQDAQSDPFTKEQLLAVVKLSDDTQSLIIDTDNVALADTEATIIVSMVQSKPSIAVESLAVQIRFKSEPDQYYSQVIDAISQSLLEQAGAQERTTEADNQPQTTIDFSSSQDQSEAGQAISQGPLQQDEIQQDRTEPAMKQTEALDIDKTTISPTGRLTMNFNRPYLGPDFTAYAEKRQLADIESLFNITVIDVDKGDDSPDKSIQSVTYSNRTATKLALQLNFTDTEAISQDILEPDQLRIIFLQPDLFVDAASGGRLAQTSHNFTIDIQPQYTAEAYAEFLKQAEAMAVAGSVVTFGELFILIAFNKVLSSMWTLVLTLQFVLYIAVWQINFPQETRLVLFELRKVALGEFMDNIPFGDILAQIFNITIRDDSSTDQKLGDARLGSGDIFARFGPTFILVSAIFAALVIIVVCSVYLGKRLGCSEKCKNCVRGIKDKIFWNSLIRYILMNALKLCMASLVVLKRGAKSDQQLAVTIAILAALSLAFTLFYCVLKRCQNSLGAENTKKRISTLYIGHDVQYENHRSHQFPVAFFLRRLIFTVVTVFLMDHPALQMIVHQFLTMGALIHLAYDIRVLSSSLQKIVEFGSEILLLVASTLLAQFNAFDPKEKKTHTAIQIFFLAALALLAFLNLAVMIIATAQAYLERSRRKKLEQQNREQESIRAAQREMQVSVAQAEAEARPGGAANPALVGAGEDSQLERRPLEAIEEVPESPYVSGRQSAPGRNQSELIGSRQAASNESAGQSQSESSSQSKSASDESSESDASSKSESQGQSESQSESQSQSEVKSESQGLSVSAIYSVGDSSRSRSRSSVSQVAPGMNQAISPSESVMSLDMSAEVSKYVDREPFVETYDYDTVASAAMRTKSISMSHPNQLSQIYLKHHAVESQAQHRERPQMIKTHAENKDEKQPAQTGQRVKFNQVVQMAPLRNGTSSRKNSLDHYLTNFVDRLDEDESKNNEFDSSRPRRIRLCVDDSPREQSFDFE